MELIIVKKYSPWFPGAIYHVTCFSRWKENIFYKSSDFISYLSALENVRYQYPFYLHSYCLTFHQIQLLLETLHVPIDDIVSSINYAYIKRKRAAVLHVNCQLIDSVSYFLKASKTIHLSPLHEHLPLKDYRWSSYQSFISPVPNDHVVTSRILTYFPEPQTRNYAFFVEELEYEANLLYS